jgi:hypothetical protein
MGSRNSSPLFAAYLQRESFLLIFVFLGFGFGRHHQLAMRRRPEEFQEVLPRGG